MALPVVAIVGRPNVGKSSLLNVLAGRRISIVDPKAGVTRDRVSTIVELEERFFELVDTGGYGIEDQDDLTEQVERQIRVAIEQADVVLFVVDVQEGILPLDRKVAELLRQKRSEVLLIANKADSPKQDNFTGEFHALGFGEPLSISALHGRNLSELIEEVLKRLPEHSERPAEQEEIKMAVVGKRNVGKSTFINAIAQEERVIVSEVPGTTRDAVDVRIEKDGRVFVAIDTAGVRKKGRITNNDIEFYSYTRAIGAIRRADVVLLFLDALEAVSQVDKKLGRFIADEYKPCILVINKWDLAKQMDAQSEDFKDYLGKMLPGLSYAPISFITATKGKNVNRLMELVGQLAQQASTTISTAALNKAIQTIVAERAPSARHKVGLPRIYYGTQAGIKPPTLLLFVNDPQKIDANYQRFVINRFRDLLPFSEVPIRLLLRHHHERQGSATGPRGKGPTRAEAGDTSVDRGETGGYDDMDIGAE